MSPHAIAANSVVLAACGAMVVMLGWVVVITIVAKRRSR